jgi:hypothetical protein
MEVFIKCDASKCLFFSSCAQSLRDLPTLMLSRPFRLEIQPAGPGAMVLGSTVSGRVIWVACYASSTLAEVSVDSGVFLAAFFAPSNPYGLVQTPGGFAATSYTGNAVVDFFLR